LLPTTSALSIPWVTDAQGNPIVPLGEQSAGASRRTHLGPALQFNQSLGFTGGSDSHAEVRDWLNSALSSRAPLFIPDTVTTGFVRLVTSLRMMPSSLHPDQVFALVDWLFEQPSAMPLAGDGREVIASPMGERQPHRLNIHDRSRISRPPNTTRPTHPPRNVVRQSSPR